LVLSSGSEVADVGALERQLAERVGCFTIANKFRSRFAMITVGMNYHVIEGKQADFEEKFAAVIGALRAADGHTSSTLWKDVSDSASYLITSEWSEEQAFLDFIHSQAFKDVTSWGKEQILSGRPQHKIYKN
jgi:heme-degrading monooxygenase HmoA